MRDTSGNWTTPAGPDGTAAAVPAGPSLADTVTPLVSTEPGSVSPNFPAGRLSLNLPSIPRAANVPVPDPRVYDANFGR